MASVTLTINPIPSDSTVTLTATGYTQVNNSITVPEGTEVTYTVSRTDYATVSGTYSPYTTLTLNITLVRPQVDVNKVMENVAELLTNSVELTDKFYTIFFDPNPQDVTFLHYDNNDQLVEVTIPNRAQDTADITAVSGSLPAITTCANNMSSIQAAPSAAEIATQQAALAKQYAEETHGQSDVMVENVRAFPAYKNYEGVQTESTGLAQLKTLYNASSTTEIDQIKADDYTTSGTGSVTSDGIASGANVLSSSDIDFSSSPAKWTFISPKFKITEATTSPVVPFAWGSASTGAINFSLRQNGVLGMNYNNTDGTGTSKVSGQNVISINTWYQCKWVYDNTTLNMYYKQYGSDWTLLETATVTACTSSGKMEFSRIATNGYECDLNTCKVYKGDELNYQPCLKIPYKKSKTGSKIVSSVYRERVEDMYSQYGWANYFTLQESSEGNYIVIGSPTISSDFVVSGCSASNYIKLPVFSTEGNDFKFSGTYITPSTLPTSNFMIIGGNNSYAYGAFQIYCNVVGNYMNATCFVNNSGTSVSLNFNVPITWAVDTSYDFYFEKSGTTYTFGAKKTSDTTYTTRTDTSSYPLYDTAQEVLGFYSGFAGSIDLKQFKVYANNALIYEAVLGANFTVPQGENLDGHVTKIDWYKNGTTSWEYDTNLDCIETGSCTSGTAVTLPKAMADTNYSLTVPYSDKTATGFTPTQTGEYIAKGKITLG